MATKQTVLQFVLLPSRGIRASHLPSSAAVRSFMASVHLVGLKEVGAGRIPAKTRTMMRVVDEVAETGAKLVELPAEALASIKAEQPGVRLVPVVYYRTAVALRPFPESTMKVSKAKAAAKIVLAVTSKTDGKPVPNATVVAFTDFANLQGAQGVTNSKGLVSLALGASTRTVERLYVYPALGYWSVLKRNVKLSGGMQIKLLPVDLGYSDCLRHFYGNAKPGSGAGVRVGVIDTGVGPHTDLVVAGGLNTVTGEQPQDFGDNGEGHGTHVAGIIAARGTPPDGIRGLAPAVEIRSYRVFGKDADGASNYAIVKAIDAAMNDGCDLINMSLGGGPPDEATHSAISDARSSGTVVIVAAGNEDRSPVDFPARESMALAISAMGRKGTFPGGTVEAGDVKPPFGDDPENFVAAFSNIGDEIDLTGPGVGVISTVPGGYAPMSGTSMACPAVTGAAAGLLGAKPQVLAMSRDQERSDAMIKVILQAAKALGFGPTYEGQGMIL